MVDIDAAERPKLNLTPEEIAAREAEKAQLLAGIGIPTPEARADVPRARRKKSRDDLVGDYEPPVLVDATYLRPGERNITEHLENSIKEARASRAVEKKITADPATLASLMQEAKQTQDEAEAAEEMAGSARTASVNARVRLNEYMREHGLA